MKRRGVYPPVRRSPRAPAVWAAVPSILILACAWFLTGCGGDLYSPGEVQGFSTLTVKYGSPGPTPSPCDDYLPVADGVYTDREWSSTEPLFVRMTDANGKDFFAEVRALWSDNSRLGASGKDRLYLMIRYEDNDRDNQPDQLAYGTVSLLTGEINPSPTPQTGVCDDVLLSANSWTRLNPNGREDQLAIIFGAGEDVNDTNIMNAAGKILGLIGPEFPASANITNAKNLDVWVWRAGRTNIQPVPLFADWDTYQPGTADPVQGQVDVPGRAFSPATWKSGFFEDASVDQMGNLKRDPGTAPYVKNFLADRNSDGQPDDDRVPVRIHEKDQTVKADDPMAPPPVVVVNGDLSKDLCLWWPTAKRFTSCDTIATNRTGNKTLKWSQRLLPGEYDQVQGWGVQTPTGSAKDVRGHGAYTEDLAKGFPVWTIELMRDFKTGNTDDVDIVFGKTYRFVIGIFDASGVTSSESHEIRLLFEPRPNTPITGEVPNQCQ